MLNPSLERELETHTVALNRWLYAESVGLGVDEAGYAAPAGALARLNAQLLDHPDTASRYFAVESWAEARRQALDARVTAAMDEHLRVPALICSEGPLTWRNWKAFEREAPHAAQLAEGFERLVEQSAAIVPALEGRLAQVRADFEQHGLTPIYTYCWREGLTPEQLRSFLWRTAEASAGAFRTALGGLSQAVFGRAPGPAELRALYLNRMYEPLTKLFTTESAEKTEDSALSALSVVQTAFRNNRLYSKQAFKMHKMLENKAISHFDLLFWVESNGFDLSHIPVDVENRPRKYPGAFCFPIATPQDVRVSVRIASPHHLVDMLYHEFGHAVHFSGIRADLPFIDRYWIHSGAHETFSTLFESWLGEREFLARHFGFDGNAVERLVAFHHFKTLLTNTWHCASALTALDGWLENLSWAEVETRYADYLRAFTGVPMPPGWARLSPFVAALSIYPAGYVLAEARVRAWAAQLRAIGGAEWWRSPAARMNILEKAREGGRATFKDDAHPSANRPW
jgi:hypothetical protein